MSVTEGGKQIVCDGEDCQAVAFLPIALRAQLYSPEMRLPSAEGWLFVNCNSARRHFCPDCTRKQLEGDETP